MAAVAELGGQGALADALAAGSCQLIDQVGVVQQMVLCQPGGCMPRLPETARRHRPDGGDRGLGSEWRMSRAVTWCGGLALLGLLFWVRAVGAGAELRQSLGTAVFSGMIGVTVFGLIFTPAFYVVSRWLAVRFSRKPHGQPAK